MKPLVKLYNCFKKEYRIKEDNLLRLFGHFLSESSCSILEYAPLITPGSIHAIRFRAGYIEKDNSTGLTEIRRFIDKISVYRNVQLNRVILNQIVNRDFNLQKVGKLGIGIDLRENINNSKLKFYFTIKDDPEKIHQILAVHPTVDNITYYPIIDMFGINLYFNGKTDIEIYPSLTREDCMDKTLIVRLGLQEIPQEFMEGCKSLFISFKNSGMRVLHFYPHRPARFISLIGDLRLEKLYSKARIIHFMLSRSKRWGPLRAIISLPEDEIISRDIQNIVLSLYHQYFHPTSHQLPHPVVQPPASLPPARHA